MNEIGYDFLPLRRMSTFPDETAGQTISAPVLNRRIV